MMVRITMNELGARSSVMGVAITASTTPTRVTLVYWVESSVRPAGMSIFLTDSDRKFQDGRQII
jgi:hypothetical protein